MHDAQSIDQYFTEQIVGGPITVDMGPSVGIAEQPRQGVLVERLRGLTEMSLLGVRSAWAGEPADVVMGRPLSLTGLARWRLGVLLAAWAGWSLLLTAVLAWAWRR
jgi:hypothetical protein